MRTYSTMLAAVVAATLISGCGDRRDDRTAAAPPATTTAPAATTDRPGQMDRSVGQTVDDATITARVKMALANDDVTRARNIDVDTRNQVVTLSGNVQSEQERQRAQQVARGVEGVGNVQDQLAVGR